VVIDALNSEAITRHHFEAYGFFSPALEDYIRHGLFPHKIGTPEYQAVLQIEDPYNYRDRPQLRMPKFMLNASGDQFFLPDNSQFYYDDLPEEKHLRYVPNARHNLAGSDATDSLIAFYQAILSGKPRPRFSWKKQADGSIVVQVVERPAEVHLWQATNPEALSASIPSGRRITPRRSRRRARECTSARSPGRRRGSRPFSSSWFTPARANFRSSSPPK
jgi:PhoPQ-activated pathogenicity-related protein